LIHLIKKWLWCSWIHKKDRCYPEVWEEESKYWHCMKCHPCTEGLEEVLAQAIKECERGERLTHKEVFGNEDQS